eukprot:scaffold117773_cov18-Prasinocladus_malaysianus.AAC.1
MDNSHFRKVYAINGLPVYFNLDGHEGPKVNSAADASGSLYQLQDQTRAFQLSVRQNKASYDVLIPFFSCIGTVRASSEA